jgi:hypothetical protein
MTEKEIYEVVKYFKEIYTSINNGSEILFSKGKFYYQGTVYSLLYGELDSTESNSFKEWIREKNVLLNIKDIDLLRNCLKKNVVSLDITDNEFKLTYKDKEENEMIFLCSSIEIPESFQNIIEKINNIEIKIDSTTIIEGLNLENKDILELYLDGSVLSENRSSDKIIEIPVKRITSLLKNSEFYINYSKKDTEGKRYVRLGSKNSLLSLNQIFATI